MKLAPSYAYPRWYLGNLLLRTDRYEEGFAELQRASEENGQFQSQLFNLAWQLNKNDFDALRAASTRVVIAVGAESGKTLARRAGEAVAERLGIEPVVFPSDHGGFLGGEYGQTGDPDAFAAKLRQVLATEA